MLGGVMVPLDNRQRRNIAKRLPEVDLDKVEDAGAVYCIERDHEAEPPANVKETMQDVARKAADIYVALSTLSEEARSALWDACFTSGQQHLAEEVASSSRMLIGIARNAHLDVEVPQHRPKGAKRGLILNLARILESAGITPDARPKGELCFLTEEVLESCGQSEGSQRTSVRSALAERSPAKG